MQPSSIPPAAASGSRRLGLVLPGGGARAAYQAGVLSRIADAFPGVQFEIVAGVSAGAINAAFLANHSGSLPTATQDLVELWSQLKTEEVMRVEPFGMLATALRWGGQLLSGGIHRGARSMVDTGPLKAFLEHHLGAETSAPSPSPQGGSATSSAGLAGITRNLVSGRLEAFAVSTTNYLTGKAVTFVQRGPGQEAIDWSRPYRRMQSANIGVDHVLASAAIPLLFPAVSLAGGWYGDGGVRQTFPLSPAIHLGAERILAISTLRTPSVTIADPHAPPQYPPLAQVLGVLVNSIFLDNVDYDATNMERINGVLRENPRSQACEGMRPVELLVIRPSADIGKLASEYEANMPSGVRYLSRGWDTRHTPSNDVLATLLFEGVFHQRLIELGRADAEQRLDDLARFFR